MKGKRKKVVRRTQSKKHVSMKGSGLMQNLFRIVVVLIVIAGAGFALLGTSTMHSQEEPVDGSNEIYLPVVSGEEVSSSLDPDVISIEQLDDGWQRVTNQKIGYSIDIPSQWIPKSWDDDGGRLFFEIENTELEPSPFRGVVTYSEGSTVESSMLSLGYASVDIYSEEDVLFQGVLGKKLYMYSYFPETYLTEYYIPVTKGTIILSLHVSDKLPAERIKTDLSMISGDVFDIVASTVTSY